MSCAAKWASASFSMAWQQTGIAKEKILKFLDADPDGKGSVRDQVTAEMTSELMKVMGIAGRQTAPEVKRIRNSVNKGSD